MLKARRLPCTLLNRNKPILTRFGWKIIYDHRREVEKPLVEDAWANMPIIMSAYLLNCPRDMTFSYRIVQSRCIGSV